MSTLHLKAIVLRTDPLGESDSLVTLLCAEQGKIRAVARGARRSKRRFMGGIDIFDCAEFELKPPRGTSTLYTLLSLAERVIWPQLQRELWRFELASLMLEISDLLSVEEDCASALYFSALVDALTELDRSPNEHMSRTTLVRLLLRSLQHAGYDPLARADFASAEFAPWWRNLQSKALLELPLDPNWVEQSCSTLLHFTERTLERQLRCAKQLTPAAS